MGTTPVSFPAGSRGGASLFLDNVKITHSGSDPGIASFADSDATKSLIAEIDAAIIKVNNQRSHLGSVSNRLTHTVSNLTNISANLSAAQGSIEDAEQRPVKQERGS